MSIVFVDFFLFGGIMTTYEIIIDLCKKNNLAVTALEKELGFGRGSIGKLKSGKTSVNRLQKIATYFNVSLEYLTTGKEKNNDLLSNYDNEIIEIAKKIANDKNLLSLFNAAQNATPKAIRNATNELKMTYKTNNRSSSTALYTSTLNTSNEQNILDIIADNIEKYSTLSTSMYYDTFHVPTLNELKTIADDLHISVNDLLCPEPFSPAEIKSKYFFCQLQQNGISVHFVNDNGIILSQNAIHYIIPFNIYDTFYSSLDDYFSLNIKTLILHADKKYYSLNDALDHCHPHKDSSNQ